jgi:hypothetical protein
MNARRDNEDKQENGGLTRWAVGVVLTVILALSMYAAAGAARTLDDTVRRVTALETAFAALQAGNVEQHKALLSGVERIEDQVDEIARTQQAQVARR